MYQCVFANISLCTAVKVGHCTLRVWWSKHFAMRRQRIHRAASSRPSTTDSSCWHCCLTVDSCWRTTKSESFVHNALRAYYWSLTCFTVAAVAKSSSCTHSFKRSTREAWGHESPSRAREPLAQPLPRLRLHLCLLQSLERRPCRCTVIAIATLQWVLDLRDDGHDSPSEMGFILLGKRKYRQKLIHQVVLQAELGQQRHCDEEERGA